LELFFKEVNLKTPYKSSSLQTYAKAIDKIALQVFSAYQNSIKSPSELTVYYLKELFIPQLKQIVTAESLLFEDFISTEFEYKLTKVYEEESYQLEGRIDRLTTKEDQVAIIDYKKKVRETLKSFRTDYDNLRAHQLPFYALLLKEVENREASIASYYDIQEGRYIKVWGEEEDELVETLKQIVKERIETMVRNLKEGSLGAVVTKQGCNYCDFREICRRRYALV
jgi:CRISPR/Cas system-associated exonuclease Cas4 (RecB family)